MIITSWIFLKCVTKSPRWNAGNISLRLQISSLFTFGRFWEIVYHRYSSNHTPPHPAAMLPRSTSVESFRSRVSGKDFFQSLRLVGCLLGNELTLRSLTDDYALLDKPSQQVSNDPTINPNIWVSHSLRKVSRRSIPIFLGNLGGFLMILLKGRACFLLSNINPLCIYLLVSNKTC